MSNLTIIGLWVWGLGLIALNKNNSQEYVARALFVYIIGLTLVLVGRMM